jgi:hypothetical protein
MIMSESAPATGVKVPAWEYLFVALLVAASIGYSVACVVALAAVGSLRSTAEQVLAGQHLDAITIQARLTAVSHASGIAAGLGWLALAVFFIWSVIVRRSFRASRQAMRPVRSWAYRVWFLAIVVSVLLAAGVSLGFDSVRTVADVHRAATFDMTLFAIRAAVGLIYVWCAVAMFAARRHLEPAPPPATVAGADLSYEEYVAMRAAQRAGAPNPAAPAAPTPSPSVPLVAMPPESIPESVPSQSIPPHHPPPQATTPRPAAGEMAIDSPAE